MNSNPNPRELKDTDGRKQLSMAAKEGDMDVVKSLLVEGAYLESLDGQKRTPLSWAARNGHEEVVRLLLEKGADPNSMDEYKQTPLIWAARDGHEEVVRLLLEKGANLESQDIDKQTPLIWAARDGHEGVVRLLLEKGANPNFVDKYEQTPLSWASERGHEVVVKLLLEKGANPNPVNEYEQTPLIWVAREGYEGVVKLLLEKGANPDFVDKYEQTPLSWAVRNGHEEVVRLLLEKGANPNSVDEYKQTPLISAARYGHKGVAELLLEKGANLEAQDMYEQTPLSWASERGHEGVVRLLLEKGPNLESKKDDIWTMPSRTKTQEHNEAAMPPREKVAADPESKEYEDQAVDNLNQLYKVPIQFPRRWDSSSDSEGDDDRDQNKVQEKQSAGPRPWAIESLLGSDDWVQGLESTGFLYRSEIEELLLEEYNDSPWIYFSPQPISAPDLRSGISGHQTHCAHDKEFLLAGSGTILSSIDRSCVLHYLHTDIRKHVEALCGIGGVAPSSRSLCDWNGSVEFQQQNTVSYVTYAETPNKEYGLDLGGRIVSVLSSFATAAAFVQSSGLCCESFTILAYPTVKDDLQRPSLKLRRISFDLAMSLLQKMKQLSSHDIMLTTNLQACTKSAFAILEAMLGEHGLALTTPDTQSAFAILENMPDDHPLLSLVRPDISKVLHWCSLATQCLCVGFLSYIQAHTGSIEPFFLDTALEKVVLLGSDQGVDGLAVEARLTRLSCLDEMTKQPVLAFRKIYREENEYLYDPSTRFDVSAAVEDLLDTWGPGYVVRDSASYGSIYAVGIGGGTICCNSDGRFHWTRGRFGPSSKSASLKSASFNFTTPMLIGSPVQVNPNCRFDEATYRSRCFCALEPLGTHGPSWELAERQATFQGGTYVVGGYNQTWKKSKAKSLKELLLEEDPGRLWPWLEQSWGLQLSFCTSISRRVPLRQLIADLLPTFVDPVDQEAWQKIEAKDPIQAFEGGNLQQWLLTLDLDSRSYMSSLVQFILEQLRCTGLDRDGRVLTVAWPRQGDLRRCFNIPCKSDSRWAHILADTDDCATFAYITPKCLETNTIKCSGVSRSWQHSSRLLATAVSCAHSSQLPPMALNWKLEDGRTYWVKKYDTMLCFKAERPSSGGVAHLVVSRFAIPHKFWKRLIAREAQRQSNRIREQQAADDDAEDVIVRT